MLNMAKQRPKNFQLAEFDAQNFPDIGCTNHFFDIVVKTLEVSIQHIVFMCIFMLTLHTTVMKKPQC